MQDFRVPDRLQSEAQEFQQRMDEIDRKVQQSLERTKRQEENIWPIVTLAATICLGLTIRAIREHRTRRRRQHVAAQAAAIVALVWEDVDPEEIRRVIDEFQIDRAYAETFKTAMMMNALFLPMPWYRVDIPKLLEAIGRYVAGQPWSVKAKEDATNQNLDNFSTTAQAAIDPPSESLKFVAAVEEKPDQQEVICPSGHTFLVPAM